MGEKTTTGSIRRLPGVLAATFAVFGLPIAAVFLLRASGAVGSLVLLTAIGTVLSIAASAAGAALWAARDGGGETVFEDLMLWGWLRRRRQERLLASAERLLGSHGKPALGAAANADLDSRVKYLKRLSAALESRDPYTHGHSRRVARHAAAVAKRMGLPRAEVARARTAASVHDVGKIEIPPEIVQKPGRLDDEEFAAIKRHAAAGAELVAGLGDEELARIVRHHHERIDGSGYPDGLAGDRIPLGARIIAVADTFDAITSTRPYRPARSHKEALKLLSAEAGTQLDPDAVRAFRAHYSGLRAVALSAFALNGPRQLLFSLVDQLRFGGAAVAAKGATAAVAAVAVGSVAVHAPAGSAEPARSGERAAAQRSHQPPGGTDPAVAESRDGGKGGVRVKSTAGGEERADERPASTVDATGHESQPGERADDGAPSEGPKVAAAPSPTRTDDSATAAGPAPADEPTIKPTEPVAVAAPAEGDAEPTPIQTDASSTADPQPDSTRRPSANLGT